MGPRRDDDRAREGGGQHQRQRRRRSRAADGPVRVGHGDVGRPRSAADIHPTAIVHPSAQIGAGTVIGPFVTIGERVRIGRDNKIGASCVIDGVTEIGDGNEIFPMTSIGLVPQDLKFGGEPTRVTIGDRNVIREFVTIHRGTAGGGGLTSIGNHNLLMAYTHIAHDCHIGNETIFGNAATLAGHVLGRGLRQRRRLLRRAPVLPRRQVRVHRRLLGGDQGRAAVRQDRRQPRADLRHQHHRPDPPRLLAGHHREAAPRATASSCTPTPAAPWRRSSATRRCSRRKSATSWSSSARRSGESACAGRAGGWKKSSRSRSRLTAVPRTKSRSSRRPRRTRERIVIFEVFVKLRDLRASSAVAQ